MSRWYYAKRGNVRLHGVADEMTISKMLQRGELRPHDLVWSLVQGTEWIPVSRAGIGTAPVAQTAAPVPVKAVAALEQPEKKSLSPLRMTARLRLLLEIMGVLIFLQLIMLLLREPLSRFDIKNPPRRIPAALPASERETAPSISDDQPQPEPTPGVDSREIAALRKEIRLSLTEHDAERSARYIMELHKITGDSPEITQYLTHLAVLRTALGRMDYWSGEFSSGELSMEDAQKWVAMAQMYGRMDDVFRQFDVTLDNREKLSPAHAMCAYRVAFSAGDTGRIHRALLVYENLRPEPRNYSELEELIQRYTDAGLNDDALQSLDAFLERVPNSTAAWLEKGALLALKGEKRSALAALRRAVKFGGVAAKRNAREDPRYDMVKETWTFRRLTRY